MLNRLRNKWKVNGGRLLLILLTFALGGSLTGWVGRKLLGYTGMESGVLYVVLYILVITALWPLMVIAVSIPTGQFFFFRHYLARLWARMSGKGQSTPTMKDSTSGSASGSRTHLVIFASGAGSNAARIIDYFRNSDKAVVSLIVCNKPGAGVIKIAEKEGIPLLLIEKERFFRGDAYLPVLREAGAGLIILAGFLWKVPQALIEAYPRKIINIHPALLPRYGGKGMYGQYVHEAVLQAGEVQSGITIHYVDEHYDNGDIIFQTACPVVEGDTPEALARRIHELEHAHYPRVIEELLK